MGFRSTVKRYSFSLRGLAHDGAPLSISISSFSEVLKTTLCPEATWMKTIGVKRSISFFFLIFFIIHSRCLRVLTRANHVSANTRSGPRNSRKLTTSLRYGTAREICSTKKSKGTKREKGDQKWDPLRSLTPPPENIRIESRQIAASAR